MFAVSLSATPTSYEQLVALSKSGIDAKAIVNLISKDGISFEVTAEVLLALKQQGVPSEVITALTSVTRSRGDAPLQSGASNGYTAAAELYKQGKFNDAAHLLEPAVKAAPHDAKSRLLLVAALLRVGERALAEQYGSYFRERSDTASARYGDAVASLLSKYDVRANEKQQLKNALNERNLSKARSTVAGMTAGADEKAVLRAIIERYAGNFQDSLAATTTMREKATSLRVRQSIERLDGDTKRAEEQYAAAIKRIDDILYSGIAPSTWNRLLPNPDTGIIEKFLLAVNQAGSVAPLAPRVMDLQWHAALLTADYAVVEKLGDTILSAKGELILPGYGRDRYVDLVIDSSRRRFYLRPDPRKFWVLNAYKPWGGGMYGSTKPGPENGRTLGGVALFDVAFNEVTSVDQHTSGNNTVGSDLGHFIRASDFALRINNKGTFPNWSLMNVMHYLYGATAQMKSTQSLGRYVVHVVGRRDVRAALADPAKAPKGDRVGTALGFFTAAAATIGGAMGGPETAGLASSLTQMSADLKNKRERDSADLVSRAGNWVAAVDSYADLFSEDAAFTVLDDLLNGL